MNRGWASEFIRRAAEAAIRPRSVNDELAGADPEAFVESVIAGLNVGAERYGEDGYRGRDNAKEGQEEARDAAAYALMAYDDIDLAADPEAVDEERAWLARAVMLSARLDYAFRQARRCRLEA